MGSVATDAQRSAAADQVQQAIQQLVNTANQEFRGRSLFSGSLTGTAPFQLNANGVLYSGNQGTLPTFGDTGLLFSTNLDGNSVFGAISDSPRLSADLNPVTSDSTQLSDLNLGQGVSKGSIAISDGSATSIVDLSSAHTLGDVAELIRRNPPAGRSLDVAVTSSGLSITLDSVGGGQLAVREVANGTTAKNLGILADGSQGSGPLIGKDLNPQVTNTTQLADLLGSRSKALITSAGSGNDLVIEAKQNGDAANGVSVSFVDDGTIVPGQETATYNAAAKTLVFRIRGGQSTVQDVANALQNSPQASQYFQARLSAHDAGSAIDPNSNLIDPTATGQLAGGSGTNLDQQSGLQISSGGQTYTIDLSGAKTVEDLLNKLNGSSAGVLAEVNAQGTGIEVRSRISGVDFSIGENGGSTASQLGIRTLTTDTRLDDLNHGIGVHTLGTGPDFTIQRKDGIQLSINLSGAKTVGDVLNLINTNAANLDPAHAVTARLSASGNGIELVTSDTSTIAPLTVTRTGASQAAQDLGLIASGANSNATSVTTGNTTTLTGADPNPQEVNGVFTALVRLEQSLRTGDDVGIQRSMALLDDGTKQITLARADLGARQQGLDTLQSGLTSEVTLLKSTLSDEIDTDMPTAISDLSAQQTAFQAALQTAASISKLSLLDFL